MFLIGHAFTQSAPKFRTSGSKLLRIVSDTNRTQISTNRVISSFLDTKRVRMPDGVKRICVSGPPVRIFFCYKSKQTQEIQKRSSVPRLS